MQKTSPVPFAWRPVAERAIEHVLVVEDDNLIRELVVRQLTLLGYRVTEAPDGPTGLKIICERTDIDLLFTDIVMPGGMSGYDLAEAAELLRPGLRILLTSGFSEESANQDGRLYHRELLHKPYRRQDLANRLRKVFENGAPIVREATSTMKGSRQIGL
jgi:CheY-like chemotaxis protein